MDCRDCLVAGLADIACDLYDFLALDFGDALVTRSTPGLTKNRQRLLLPVFSTLMYQSGRGSGVRACTFQRELGTLSGKHWHRALTLAVLYPVVCRRRFRNELPQAA